jgi:hypothetical protein
MYVILEPILDDVINLWHMHSILSTYTFMLYSWFQ